MSSVTHINSCNLNTVCIPEHRLHSEDDPLPGVKGATPAADCLTDGKTRSGNGSNSNIRRDLSRGLSNNTNTSLNAEQPVDNQRTSETGIAAIGRNDSSEGQLKVTMGDKLIGKTQKIVGKYTHNMDMHDMGELRELGGKAAVQSFISNSSF